MIQIPLVAKIVQLEYALDSLRGMPFVEVLGCKLNELVQGQSFRVVIFTVHEIQHVEDARLRHI